jgi:hypothetical protein
MGAGGKHRAVSPIHAGETHNLERWRQKRNKERREGGKEEEKKE